MSKKNSVNPDHYKIAGRDRLNKTALSEQEKREFAQAKAGRGRACQT